MFPMIAEKVAGEHCPEMIFFQGSRSVRAHLVGERRFMRQVGAKVKELQRAPRAWQYPKQPDARFRYEADALKEIIQRRHREHLRHGCVAEKKRAEPDPKVLRLHIKVRVAGAGRHRVMLLVMHKQTPIGHCAKKPTSKVANRMVEPAPTAHRAMHRIVRGDEQSCGEVTLRGKVQVTLWHRPREIAAEKINQVNEPKRDDAECDEDAHTLRLFRFSKDFLAKMRSRFASVYAVLLRISFAYSLLLTLSSSTIHNLFSTFSCLNTFFACSRTDNT